MGKSHIIAFTAMLLLDMYPQSKVFVQYSSDVLRQRDSEMMSKVGNYSGNLKRIRIVTPGIGIKPKRDDFVIVDECDEVQFSNLKWFEKVYSELTVIGFTATVPDAEDALEKRILKQYYGDNQFDS